MVYFTFNFLNTPILSPTSHHLKFIIELYMQIVSRHLMIKSYYKQNQRCTNILDLKITIPYFGQPSPHIFSPLPFFEDISNEVFLQSTSKTFLHLSSFSYIFYKILLVLRKLESCRILFVIFFMTSTIQPT